MKRRWLTLIVSVLVAALMAGSALATYPGSKNGRLAFGARVDGNFDIYSVQPDGSGLKRLTSGPELDLCPSWSADGKSIVFCSNRSGAFEVWIMKHNGKAQRQVTALGTHSIFPDLSPDGRRVVFQECPGDPDDIPNTCGLMVADVMTGEVTVLYDVPGVNEEYPVWSPDGSKIAFLSYNLVWDDESEDFVREDPQIWTMAADGTGAAPLTSDELPKDQLPDWHPSGDRIAYEAGEDIFTVTLLGDVTRLTSSGGVGGPVWSPDGTMIAYRNYEHSSGSPKIEVMQADGTGAVAVLPGLGGSQAVPGWQPKGKVGR